MPATPIGPCPCPAVGITYSVLSPSEILVTVVAGGEVRVTLGFIDGTQYEQHGEGPFLFAGLDANTVYSLVAQNDCGESATEQITTVDCPQLTITQVTETVNTITVRIDGDAAEVTLAGQVAQIANGASHTFTGLTPGTDYTVLASTLCGARGVETLSTQACPAIAAAAVTTVNSMVVTVAGGAPATVTVAGITKTVATNGSAVSFTGLTPGSEYNAVVQSECGNAQAFTFATQPCPSISASHVPTVNSMVVTVTTGAPATVSLGGITKTVAANGGNAEFTGLTPGSEYNAVVQSDCGNVLAFAFATNPCPTITITSVETVDSVAVTVASGAPATVSVAGLTRIVDTDGGVATFTDLLADTEYMITVDSACGNNGIFVRRTPACAVIEATVSGVGFYGFSVDITAGGPVDLEVYDGNNTLVAAIDAANGLQVLTDLKDGELYRLLASSACGSEWRDLVQTPPFVPFCASYPLYKFGYAYTEGDNLDPAADVPITAGSTGIQLYIYATAAPGRTAPVRNAAGELLGYAANTSECKFDGCCEPDEYTAEVVS